MLSAMEFMNAAPGGMPESRAARAARAALIPLLYEVLNGQR